MQSEHFKESELECRCGCGLCNATSELLELAEGVRAVLGAAMVVHSCCRCEKHNAAVNGSATSKHLSGQAMDFHAVGISPSETYRAIVAAYEDGLLPSLGGVGLYSWGVHIDTAKAVDGHLRTWRG